MRTTIELNEALLRAAKRRAADEGVTLKELFERSLRLLLSGRTSAAKGYRLRLKTRKGRLLPGIDLADRDSLFDAMEGRR